MPSNYIICKCSGSIASRYFSNVLDVKDVSTGHDEKHGGLVLRFAALLFYPVVIKSCLRLPLNVALRRITWSRLVAGQ